MTFKLNSISNAPGYFITFEGIDGAGKSTHVDAFCQALGQKFPERQVILTREPGGTELGEKLRELLLHHPMHLESEALLMFAARREHLAQVIEPALARGDIVISDRFTDATFAYQGGGRGLDLGKLDILESWVQGRGQSTMVSPNLTLLFDLPSDVAQARRSAVRQPDKFEVLDLSFFENVRAEYLRRARADTARFKIIDATKSREDIWNLLENIISSI